MCKWRRDRPQTHSCAVTMDSIAWLSAPSHTICQLCLCSDLPIWAYFIAAWLPDGWYVPGSEESDVADDTLTAAKCGWRQTPWIYHVLRLQLLASIACDTVSIVPYPILPDTIADTPVSSYPRSEHINWIESTELWRYINLSIIIIIINYIYFVLVL